MKWTLICLLFLAASDLLQAQSENGTRERITVYSEAIANNLVNDPAEREVTVYLPPSYKSEPGKRYPVLYMLHGYTDTDSQWFGWEKHWINLYEVLESALEEGTTKEMIVVMPNAYNRFRGSMYSSSVTIGDWETFVSGELVNYMDSHYRTIADPASRGLAGHSMGGYGTIRLGMKYPEVWSAIYVLSPCCLDASVLNTSPETMKEVESITSMDQLEDATFSQISTLALASAWAPNPHNPPFYHDLPFADGQVLPEVVARFAANQPMYMIDQYIFNLKQLKGIGMDVGDQDMGTASTTRMHEIMQSNGIVHSFEVYEGDHLNRIAERIRTRVLPFFSEKLVFE